MPEGCIFQFPGSSEITRKADRLESQETYWIIPEEGQRQEGQGNRKQHRRRSQAQMRRLVSSRISQTGVAALRVCGGATCVCVSLSEGPLLPGCSEWTCHWTSETKLFKEVAVCKTEQCDYNPSSVFIRKSRSFHFLLLSHLSAFSSWHKRNCAHL